MFSTQQLEVLHAAINRIIPPDDFPGGWEAGVGDYFMRQFEGDLKDLVTYYSACLDALDDEAQLVIGSHFAAANEAAQDSLLSLIEKGSVTTKWPFEPEIFFSRLVDHSMEGFYSDPGNGGNRDQIAWKMIGFEVRG